LNGGIWDAHEFIQTALILEDSQGDCSYLATHSEFDFLHIHGGVENGFVLVMGHVRGMEGGKNLHLQG